MTETYFHAVVLAGGKGSRLGGTPKQYRQLHGQDVWLYAILALASHPRCRGGVVVCSDGENAYHDTCLAAYHLNHWTTTTGGKERQDSVIAGLTQLSDHKPDAVFIHDAARPFVTSDVIDRLLAGYHKGYLAVIPVLPSGDSLKKVTDQHVTGQYDRDKVMRVQTPQLFHFDTIYDLHHQFAGAEYTDDSSLAEQAGLPVLAVEGDPKTFKITTESDWMMAQLILPTQNMETRIGFGYDVHRFDQSEKGDNTKHQIMLAGISLDHDQAIIAHSDGDVALHALTDAILGAIGDGDIGTHFPPSDEQWRDASSDLFLLDALRRLSERGGKLVNIDITIIAEAPKIMPHRSNMIKTLSDLTKLAHHAISIKATTSESMGFVGRQEGLAAHAVVSITLPVTGDQ
ncbi:MAG: 2-C-methyl-D-erythritol 4-phosphate cytidylyltransferase [Candidatus Puniceispirillales bacterium]|nr:2-C-methyl-D-erythritol 4-phosphate cytidylyltransferase [Pseudomonadota bacterium]